MKVFVSHFYVDFDVSLTAIGATLEAAQHATEQTAKKYMGIGTIMWKQDGDRMIGSFPKDECCFIIEEEEVVTDEC
jgi:hypothetical protein